MTKWTLLFFALAIPFGSWSQRMVDTDAVLSKCREELDASCANGSIREYVTKSQLKGTYTFELTVKNKGQVVSMNILERGEDGTISFQNDLKDFIMYKFRFSFKVEKNRYYKFDYTFSF